MPDLRVLSDLAANGILSMLRLHSFKVLLSEDDSDELSTRKLSHLQIRVAASEGATVTVKRNSLRNSIRTSITKGGSERQFFLQKTTSWIDIGPDELDDDLVQVMYGVSTVRYTLYTIHCTLYTIHYTLYTIHYTLYTIHYTL